MKPKVSIVIPVYNGSNYMREAIDSAINQTYDNCEVIVINDGSTDNGETERIALSYGDKIKYFSKANGGVATAINYGIEKMTGDYFAWLSHDDVYYPEKIEKQIEAVLCSGNENSICYGNFDFLNMDTGDTIHINLLEQYQKKQLELGCFSPIFFCIHGSTVLFHKSHFERVGNYRVDLTTTQDSEFLFRVMRDQQVVFLENRLIIGRLHREQGQRTIACHKDQYNELVRYYCDELTKEEKILFCGSELNFYYRLYCYLKNIDIATPSVNFLKSKMRELMLNREFNNTHNNKDLFDMLEHQKDEPIYIVGAGNFGKNALDLLKSYGIKKFMFLDNSPEKNETIINDVVCYNPQNVTLTKNSITVVAMRDSEDVIKQLSGMGVEKIIKYTELDKELFNILPNNLIIGD